MKRKPEPKWISKLYALIYNSWEYHAVCDHINLRSIWIPEGQLWAINAAPVFQELYGGLEDGKKIWTGFVFDLNNFSQENGIWIKQTAVGSFCEECQTTPFLEIVGKYRGNRFIIKIHMEPLPDSEAVEIIDTIESTIGIKPKVKETIDVSHLINIKPKNT